MTAGNRGFTLIELMVSIAILGVLIAVAIPTFRDSRERASVRGAGDQLVSFWANARLEALKRNQPIAVSLKTNASGGMCIGADTDTSAACDCFTSAACDIGQYPTTQGDWSGATAVGNPTLGDDDTDVVGMATIDPKRGLLDDASAVGGVTVQSSNTHKFQLRFHVDRWARPLLCAPTGSGLAVLPDYTTRTCDS